MNGNSVMELKRSFADVKVAPRLPKFADNFRPAPESAGRKLFIHSVAMITLFMSIAYLVWRATSTIDLGVWWVSLPLIIAEGHMTVGLLLYTLALWDIDASPPWRPVDNTDLKIAVLIPTYSEPEEVLIPTIAAAVALSPDHETWVLDDGHRPEIAKLVAEMGARYLTRPDNRHAKAGNINHALKVVDADVVAIFDADHVASPDFLRHTLCYFDDPKIAVVQTPQDFYNVRSFEHEGGKKGFLEEAVFYRVIAPGKNKWNGAFWCGTSAIVRTAALQSIGGVATDTVTEDIHSTILMNRAGWKAVYHNEVLARGLAPNGAVEYMIQRNRWATGAMQVLRLENPFWSRGLSFGQRLSFATTLFGWFDSWRTLAFVVLPALVLFTGAAPIDAPGYVYIPLFLAAFVSQFFALRLLARGYYPPVLSLIFEMLRMPAVLPATLAILNPHKPREFKVTPKGARDVRNRAPAPALLVALLVSCATALVWFAASLFGLTFITYDDLSPIIGSAIFCAGNFLLVWAAVVRIRAPQFASNRRTSVRFEVEVDAEFEGFSSRVDKMGWVTAPLRKRCRIVDISLTGARAIVQGVVPPDIHSAQLTLDLDNTMRLRVEVVRATVEGNETVTALHFMPGQRKAVGELALRILNSRDAYTQAPQPQAPARQAQAAAA